MNTESDVPNKVSNEANPIDGATPSDPALDREQQLRQRIAFLTAIELNPMVMVLFGDRFKEAVKRIMDDYHAYIAMKRQDDASEEMIRLALYNLLHDLNRTITIWSRSATTFALVPLLLIALLASYHAMSSMGLIPDQQGMKLFQTVGYSLLGTILYYAAVAYADSKEGKLVSLIPRLLISILVPILFFSIYYTDEGKVNQEFTIDDGTISFICGYSATTAIEIINKIVDKASKTINAFLG
ncbi:MAG: hypothetical protein HQL51_14120 [Magnetococcales bacterium]|nr:hypothetical protein [Magnetococcales bacterium]